MQLEPRLDALEVEEVGLVAWEAYDERELICTFVI
jgi:hypothetical protein